MLEILIGVNIASIIKVERSRKGKVLSRLSSILVRERESDFLRSKALIYVKHSKHHMLFA